MSRVTGRPNKTVYFCKSPTELQNRLLTDYKVLNVPGGGVFGRLAATHNFAKRADLGNDTRATHCYGKPKVCKMNVEALHSSLCF